MDIFVVLYNNGEAVAQVMFRANSLQPQQWWRSANVVHSSWYAYCTLNNACINADQCMMDNNIGVIYHPIRSHLTHYSQCSTITTRSPCYPHVYHRRLAHVMESVGG